MQINRLIQAYFRNDEKTFLFFILLLVFSPLKKRNNFFKIKNNSEQIRKSISLLCKVIDNMYEF